MYENVGLGVDVGSLSCRFALVDRGPPVPLSVPRQFDEAEREWAVQAGRGDPLDQSLLWKEMLGRDDPAFRDGPYGPRFVRQLLARGVRAAEALCGVKLRRAALVVPARFFTRQRQTLRACATAAGVPDPHLVSDSVALVAAYAQNRSEGHVLAYQCGHLGFETAVVSFQRGGIHVLSSGGGEAVSGRKVDSLLVEQLVERLMRTPEAEKLVYGTLGGPRKIAGRLREELAQYPEVAVNFDVPGRRIADVVVTRSRWHQDVRRLVESTLAEVDGVLERARLRAQDVTDVLLAGGPTAHPAFAEVLRGHLGRTPARRHGWSLAFGAAILASRVSGTGGVEELALDTSAADSPMDAAELGVLSSAALPGGAEARRGALTIAQAGQPGTRPTGSPVSAEPPAAEPPPPSLARTLAMRSLGRAEELLRQGKYQEAVSMSHQAFEDDRESPDVLPAMLQIHRRAADAFNTPEGYEKSVEWLSCASRHDLSNVSVRHALADRHLLHARQMLERARLVEAAEAAQRAFRFRPESPETERLLAEIRRATHGPEAPPPM